MYIGRILGLLILVERLPDLKQIKKYVYFVPLLQVILFFYYTIKLACNKSWAELRGFIAIGDKSLITLYTILEVMPMIEKEEQRKKAYKLRIKAKRQKLNVLIENLFCSFNGSPDNMFQ
jgi:hypothetical protein